IIKLLLINKQALTEFLLQKFIAAFSCYGINYKRYINNTMSQFK
ncbi:hypothetical protein YPPY64_1908, partial [Yersinia pestis PY-64]